MEQIKNINIKTLKVYKLMKCMRWVYTLLLFRWCTGWETENSEDQKIKKYKKAK
jgi:hypothetical protein